MLRNASILFCMLAIPFTAHAENWVGYGGDMHHSSSAIDIDGQLEVAWDYHFTNMVPVTISGSGVFQSRNLAAYNGMIAVVANIHPGGQSDRARVQIINAYDGTILNSIQTEQQGGYPSHLMWDAVETFPGEQVIAWDPDTEALFLCIGSDHPEHGAWLPLANTNTYVGVLQPGVGAWEWMAAYTNFQSSRFRSDLGRYCYRRDEDSIRTGNPPQQYYEWDAHVGGPARHAANRVSFFDLQPGSPWLVSANNSGHEYTAGSGICNKYTGRHAGEADDVSIYSQLAYMTIWKRFPGMRVDGHKIYFLGPYEPGKLPNELTYSQKGIYLKCLEFQEQDLRDNDGYTGPGIGETANKISDVFIHTIESDASDGPGISWREADMQSRAKAWFVVDNACWLAWRPNETRGVELIRFFQAGYNRYELGVGSNMIYTAMFPNIAYADLDANGEYIVYYLASHNGANNGPTTLTVFDVAAGAVPWSYELQNATFNGTYPDLPPGPAGSAFCETSRMIVAGKHAFVSWVDTTGTSNAVLKVVSFDITSPAAPGTPPVPFEFELTGTLASTYSKTRVIDMIAIDGMLYVLITEDTDFYGDGICRAQRVVAIGVAGRPHAVISSITPDTGTAPLIVKADGSGSFDSDGTITDWAWDFHDGTHVAHGEVVWHVFTNGGSHMISLNVTDNDSRTHSAITTMDIITPGGSAGSVTINGSDDTTVKDTCMKDNGLPDDGARTDDGMRSYASAWARLDTANSRWRYPLLWFDLSSIPGSEPIREARLELYAEVAGDSPVTAYAVNENWNHTWTCFNLKDDGTWWNAGSAPFDPTGASGDFDLSSAVTVPTITTGYNAWNVSNVVSQWVTGTRSNYGFVLMADNDSPNATTFSTSNNGIPDRNSRLYVAYGVAEFPELPDTDDDGALDWQEIVAGTDTNAPESCLRFVEARSAAGDNHVLRWLSATGRYYWVEISTNLVESSGWVPISGELSSQPPFNSFTTDVGTAIQRFYRIRVEQ